MYLKSDGTIRGSPKTVLFTCISETFPRPKKYQKITSISYLETTRSFVLAHMQFNSNGGDSSSFTVQPEQHPAVSNMFPMGGLGGLGRPSNPNFYSGSISTAPSLVAQHRPTPSIGVGGTMNGPKRKLMVRFHSYGLFLQL